MAGRHSKRRGVHARIPARRGPAGIELADALTSITHRVEPDELLAGRARGNYQAICGARFPVASMADPGRSQCQPCLEQVVS